MKGAKIISNYTQEEYDIAKGVNLVTYLQQSGYNLKQKGKEFCLEEHDSLTINPDKNNWYWFSKNIGGGTIQFLEKYENMGLVEAVNKLSRKSNYETIYKKYETKQEVKKIMEKKELILPQKNENNKRVQAYLSKTRGIDFEIINHHIKNGNIFEGKEKHEAIFLSKDKNGIYKYAFKRATLTDSKFKGDVTGSNKNYGFKENGKSQKLYVFESPIDLLSHQTLTKITGKDWKVDNRLSLGTVTDRALEQYLKDYSDIKEIILFLDNDKAGIDGSKKIYDKYSNKYKVDIVTTNIQKDLNEMLVKYKNDIKADKNISISNYIKKINGNIIKFTPLKKSDDDRLYRFLRKNTNLDNEMLIKGFANNDIYENQDKFAIFNIKNEKGDIIGAYKIDIYSEDKKYSLVENSYNGINIDDYLKKQDIAIKKYIEYIQDELDSSNFKENIDDLDYQMEA